MIHVPCFFFNTLLIHYRWTHDKVVTRIWFSHDVPCVNMLVSGWNATTHWKQTITKESYVNTFDKEVSLLLLSCHVSTINKTFHQSDVVTSSIWHENGCKVYFLIQGEQRIWIRYHMEVRWSAEFASENNFLASSDSELYLSCMH